MTLNKEEKAEMLSYLGFEVDEHDWTSIKGLLEQLRKEKPKYDILYWSDKSKRGYIVRAIKIN